MRQPGQGQMSGLFIPDYVEINGGGYLHPDATVEISGAKNEVLGAMAAAVLTDQPVEFHNVPYISDVLNMGHMLIELGADVRHDPENKILHIHAQNITSNQLSDTADEFRASYYLWGALLARFQNTGEFNSLRIKMPGGCGFSGSRKSDYHLELLRNTFRVEETLGNNYIEVAFPPAERNCMTEPVFATDLMSHGATMHWLLANATRSEFKVCYNASLEPEVPHLLGILNKMGANLRGTATTAITNLGRDGLLRGGSFAIMPDRMETGSYVLLAMALRDSIRISGMDSSSCRPWYNSMHEIIMRSNMKSKPNSFYKSPSDDLAYFDFLGLQDFPGRRFVMSPFPGKETDLHQIWTPVLAEATTGSEIYDPVWTGRHAHLPELAKFGIKTSHTLYNTETERTVANKTLHISIKPSKIRSADVTGMDLRGTFALMVAASVASGQSRITKPGYALRGYPNLIRNLQSIGIKVKASKEGTFVPALPPLSNQR